MFLFDIKCFILVSVFENILVLEGLKKAKEHAFTPYRSYYLRNDRRNNDFDYKFKDWETTTPDTLYDLSNKPLNIEKKESYNQTSPKETPMATNDTYSVQTTPTVENSTIVTQESEVTQEISEVTQESEVTTIKEETESTESPFLNLTLQTTIPTIHETNSTIYLTNSSVLEQNIFTPDIIKTETLNDTLPPEATVEDLLNWLATTSITEYTTVIPPPPTVNVEELMPGFSDDILKQTIPLIPSTTTNPILDEIKDDVKILHGYFTSCVHELLTILIGKSPGDVKKLLTALNNKINSYIAVDALAVFGNLIVEVFQSVIQMLVLSPNDTTKGNLQYASYAVENRHTAMGDDVNAVFDVVDTIYTDNDVTRIASVLKRIKAFPNMTKDIVALVTDTLNAFIFEPHNRIRDTAKERLLLIEIHNALQQRLYPGQQLGRRFGKRKENGKLSRWKSTNKITGYSQYSRKPYKYKTRGIHYIKHKSIIRNIKPTNIKRVHNMFYRKNHKEKYDATKIPMTIKNFYEDRDIRKMVFENSLQFHSTASSESSWSHNESSGSLESRYKYKSKTVNDKYYLKNDIRYFKVDNENFYKNKSKFEINKVSKKHKTVLSQESTLNREEFDKFIPAQSAEDNILKLNLIDALIHSKKTIKRKSIKRNNKVREIESFSDDEAILKSNIYKVFGLSHDFRRQLRTLNILRRTSPA